MLVMAPIMIKGFKLEADGNPQREHGVLVAPASSTVTIFEEEGNEPD
jgi:hypothetical protein